MLLLLCQCPRRKNRCFDLKELKSIKLNFFVSDTERQQIKEKMNLYGCENMSAYLRKMAIDGYVINLDIPEIGELISLLRRASNNINQIAKRVNSTDRIYENEIKEIQNFQEEIWGKINGVLIKLSQIS